MSRQYEAIYGFNTKQWWAYDAETEEVCDPPIDVLDEVTSYSFNVDEQQEYFEKILDTSPSWLDDKEYRYSYDFDL